ncbi:MAG: BREX system ATP-binding domain-containing protein [Acidimicrobiia bacterium]
MTRTGPLDAYGPRLGHGWPPDAGRWQQIDGTLGFFDVSGYTRLTERLARLGPRGAERITDIADDFFKGLIAAAFAFGGDVLQFSGDAVLVHFTGDGHPERAVRAANAMQAFIRTAGALDTEIGRVRLRMSVGMHSGPATIALLGDAQRVVLAIGEHTSCTLAAEKEANAGEVLVSRTTAAAIEPAWIGGGRGEFVRIRLRRRAADTLPELDPQLLRPAVEPDVARRFVPVPLRSLLTHGRLPGEHRQLGIAFVGVKRLDQLLAHRGTDEAVAALVELSRTIERVQADYELAWTGTNALPGAADFILIAGTPEAHEDDEDRLLLACREILDADLGLEIAAGVNRGRNFTGDTGHPWRHTYSISGDATNLAARIMARAVPGQLLVHEPLMRRVRGVATVTPQPPFMAKGKRLPVATVQLDALRSRDDARGEAVVTLGRDDELALLRSRLERSAHGAGTCVEIVGAAGTGKSHLLRAVRQDAGDRRWVQAVGEPYARTRVLHPLRRLLRSLLGLDDAADAAAVTQRLRVATHELAPDVLPWLPLLAAVAGGEVGSTPETERLHPDYVAEQRAAVVAALVVAHAHDPMVIAFEDLHWFDDASREIVAHIARGAEGVPLLVVATRRPGEESAFDGVEDALRLDLAPLPPAAGAALVIDAAGTTALSERQLRRLVERAAGNPLFLRELGAAATRDHDGAIPETVERVLASRIDRLEHHDRIRLREAAVAGNPVDLELLARALGRPELHDDLTWLPVRDVAEVADGRLTFTHDLARAAAYEGLSHARRREVHADLARALAGRAAVEAGGANAPLIALHWSGAEVWHEAWTWGRAAVRDTMARSAPADAYALAERALDAARRIPGLAPGEVAELTETAGDLANRIGLLDDAHREYERARVLARSDPIARARLARKRGDVAEKEGRYSASLRWYRRGERELADAPAGRTRDVLAAELRLGYAATLHCQDRNAASRQMTIEILPVAEREGDDLLAQTYLQLATMTALLDRPDGEPYASRAAEVISARADDLRLACLHLNLGVAEVEANHFRTGLDHYEDAERHFERCGDAVGAALAVHNRGEVLALLGDPGAVESFTDALRRFRASGYRAGEHMATSGLGRAAAFAGDLDRARALLESTREGFEALGHRAFVLDTELRLAEVALLAANDAEADRRLTAIAADLDELERRGFFPVWHDRLRGAVLARTGHPDEADALLAGVVDRSIAAGFEIEAAVALDARATIAGPGPAADRYRHDRDEIVGRLGVVQLLQV